MVWKPKLDMPTAYVFGYTSAGLGLLALAAAAFAWIARSFRNEPDAPSRVARESVPVAAD